MGARTAVVALLLLTAAHSQTPPPKPQVEGSQPRAWNGELVDANKTACSVEAEVAGYKGACPVSVQTAAFALVLPDGRLVKLDEGGNAKAIEALKKSRGGSKAVVDYWRSGKTSKRIKSRITGTLTSEVLNVETIRID